MKSHEGERGTRRNEEDEDGDRKKEEKGEKIDKNNGAGKVRTARRNQT